MPTQKPTPSAILSRAVIVYAAPDGPLLGAVDSTRAYTPTARYGGSDWLQVDVAGSGKVWVHQADVSLTDADQVARLPDLAPPPTPIPPPPPPAPVVVYAPPPPPPACTPDRYVGHARSVNGETWSCVSQAAAEAQLAAINAQARTP
jgi:hypothetical protein